MKKTTKESLKTLSIFFKKGISKIIKHCLLERPDPRTIIRFKEYVDVMGKVWLSHPIQLGGFWDVTDKIDYYVEDIILDDNIRECFEKLFPIKFDFIELNTGHEEIAGFQLSFDRLFVNCCYKVFHEFLRDEKQEISEILKKLSNEWLYLIENESFSLEILFKIDNLRISKNLVKNDNIRFYFGQALYLKNLSPREFYGLNFNYISFKTDLKVFLQFSEGIEKGDDNLVDGWGLSLNSIDNYQVLQSQYKNVLKGCKKFLCAMYVHGFKIPEFHPIILTPWWYEPEINALLKIFTWHPDEWDNSDIKEFTEESYDCVIKTYDAMEKKEFFQKNPSPLERSLIELALSEKKGIDRIFEAHILLEYLFCTGHSHELSFRIALNAALFISSNFTDFELNFNIFKEYYKIRSSAIHGRNWEDNIKELKKKFKGLNIKIYSLDQLVDVLEEKLRLILRKLLDYEKPLPKLIKQFNEDSLFFLRKKKEILGY